MKKNILIILTGVVIIGVGWFLYTIEKYKPTTYVENTTSGEVTINTTTGTSTLGSKSFTLPEISSHDNATSCYSAINGQIYDLTAWVNMHPGGQGPILAVCGTDGTKKFMKEHKGGEKFMTILTRFKIGTLVQ